jgi:hypothetical protein
MARKKQNPGAERRSLIAQYKREGYERLAFDSEDEASAFIVGLDTGRDAYNSNLEAETLPPVKGKKPEWTVWYKVEHYEEEEFGYP